MRKVGFIGYGKIGSALVKTVKESSVGTVAFVKDPFFNDQEASFPIIKDWAEIQEKDVDVVIEVATADVLKDSMESVLMQADIMPFSLTAFADDSFLKFTKELLVAKKRSLYLPHGAILGLDGISAAKSLLKNVSIKTVKNPASLHTAVEKRTVLYEGPTRGACKEYPRNVNVHAAIALVGLGFDATKSSIIADPEETNNTHYITIEGEGFSFSLTVSSITTGGVSGEYTLQSAKDSVLKVCQYNAPSIKLV